MAGPEDKRIIKELIAHINRVESKVKELQANLSDMNDLQLLNKLDIINLKNELEKLKMVFPEEAPEIEEKPKEAEEKSKEKPKKEPEEKPRDFLVCGKCGAILPLKAKFCSKCGKKVSK